MNNLFQIDQPCVACLVTQCSGTERPLFLLTTPYFGGMVNVCMSFEASTPGYLTSYIYSAPHIFHSVFVLTGSYKPHAIANTTTEDNCFVFEQSLFSDGVSSFNPPSCCCSSFDRSGRFDVDFVHCLFVAVNLFYDVVRSTRNNCCNDCTDRQLHH